MDDLFSSYKGPGLMGMLLGILVLACFAGLGLAVFDGRFNGEFTQSLDKKVAMQEGEIKRLENRALQLDAAITRNRTNRSVRSEVEVLQKRIQLTAETAEELKGEVELAKEAVEGVKIAHRNYRQNYRDAIRARAIGEKFEELKTLTDKVFKSVKIRSIDALGMSILYENGTKRIPYEELPIDMQDLYQFGPEEAAAQRAEEERIAKAHENRMKKVGEQEQVDRQKQKDRRVVEDRAKIERKITQLQVGIRSAHNRIQDESAKAAAARRMHSDALARGNVSSHLSKAKKAQQNIDRLRDQIDKAELQIVELQNTLRESE